MDFNPLALPPEPGGRQKLITLTNFSFLNYFRRRSNETNSNTFKRLFQLSQKVYCILIFVHFFLKTEAILKIGSEYAFNARI
ncbi:hypothetical protein [Cardinium endosymbiont of Tipula unca]|uniref:hypothetical protein n=1 Tax=Cardinium endosymbiont of Tipula unca TaxID=3066216 RepID=UPI0030CFDEE7